MIQEFGQPLGETFERPRFAPAATEDLLLGGRRLRAAFLQTPQRFAGRDTPLLRAGVSEPAAILIRSGFAYRSCMLPDGRRAILRILLSGDHAALDNAVDCPDADAGEVSSPPSGRPAVQSALRRAPPDDADHSGAQRGIGVVCPARGQ